MPLRTLRKRISAYIRPASRGAKPRLSFYGGVGAVTGANFLFETGTKRFLIDCGLLQGLPSADQTNAEPFDYDVSTIDALFVTHAHIDHIGKIPKLMKDGFKGVIYSTPETREIARLMLEDMAHIIDANSRESGAPPLYGPQDVANAFTAWQIIAYHEPQELGDCRVELFDAGHILGSAMYKFTFPSGKTILFTGDTGNSPAPLEQDTEVVSGLTYLLIDSVYGDRNHEAPEERDRQFKDLLKRSLEQGKTVVIPSFALERTQILLYELHNLFERNEIKKVPVFLDSPLAIRVTALYEKAFGNIFSFPKLQETVSVRDSKEIELVRGPKIIIAGSGMSTAGRILAHEARYLPDPDAVIVMVGYQAPGTLGRHIQSGQKSVEIKGEKVAIRAQIATIDGFSAHKDSDHLVEFVSHTASTLEKCFVVMGEPKSEIFLAQRLHDELGIDAVVPKRGDVVTLDL